MAKSIRSLLRALLPLSLFLNAAAAGEPPKHVILFVVDGLSYKTWDKLTVPTLRRLAQEGVLVEKDYLPPPAHPKTGAYADLHTCSIPNPIMMAGTLFISRQTRYLHQSFADSSTAFVVNSVAYPTLAAGYRWVHQKDGPDSESVNAALGIMRNHRPRFMRVHLQNTGSAGFSCLSTDKSVDWRGNIWADDSPYRLSAEKADSLLNVFLDGLKKCGVLDECMLLVVGDHGQDDGGWHPLQLPDGAITTFVLWGRGVKRGIVIPYAEHIDIAPTLAAVAGVQPPPTSQGRVLAEGLENPQSHAVVRTRTIKELNEQLYEYDHLVTDVAYAVARLPRERQGRFYYRLDLVKQGFYDIGRFTEWTTYGNLDELYANNRKMLTNLRGLREDVNAVTH